MHKSEWSKQRDGCSLAHKSPVTDPSSFKSTISQFYMGVSAWCFEWIFDGMTQKEVSAFQFVWCLIWEPGDSIFWVKIGLPLGRFETELSSLVPLLYSTITANAKPFKSLKFAVLSHKDDKTQQLR